MRSENNYYSEIKDIIPQGIQDRPLPPINYKDNPNNNEQAKSGDSEKLTFKDGRPEADSVVDVHRDNLDDNKRQKLNVTDDAIIMHENDDVYNSSSSELSDVDFASGP